MSTTFLFIKVLSLITVFHFYIYQSFGCVINLRLRCSLFKDKDSAKYFIEGKFNDGWAKRQMIFTDTNEASQDEVISYASIQGFVKPDGSVPFTSPITGIAPSNDLHLATKKYADDLL